MLAAVAGRLGGGGRLAGGAPESALEKWLKEKYGKQDPATVTEIEGAPEGLEGE